jgi:5-methylcytosine-specific restriction protein A
VITATVCAVPGCPATATYRGRCAAHARALRTARDRPGSTTAWRALRAEVLRRDGYRCWLCGGLGADSADHLVRVADGGGDSLANLRAAHLSCNARRG